MRALVLLSAGVVIACPSLMVFALGACSGASAGLGKAESSAGKLPRSDGGSAFDGTVSAPDATVSAPDGMTSPDTQDPSADASPALDGSISPGPTGCSPIAIDSTAMVSNSGADTYTWQDSQCKPRTAAMIRNDAPSGLGDNGGYVRTITYQTGGQQRTCTGTGANGWNGFGYIVNHYGSGAGSTNGIGGTYSIVLSGRHHAIHQYQWTVSIGGTVNVTAQWIFETGRDHPLYSVTFDATPAGPNVVNADTRAPYGDIAWDNDAQGPVEGVGWGDHYQFKTTGPGPVTVNSPWDYTQPNVVPYAYEWSASADAEMGLVAPQTFDVRKQGGDYGGGLLMAKWGQTDTILFPPDAAATTDMPEWLWPFQLNQYELQFVNNSHRVAWGATYGAVGQTSYTTLGQTLSGYPFQSYTVFVVLGTHAQSAVMAETSEVSVIAQASLSATRGTASTMGPAGVGRTDTVAYAPVGFDPVYAAWDAQVAQNAATLTLGVPAGSSLTNPVFHLHGYTASAAPGTVTFAGRTLTADVDYFATVDTGTSSLWITLNLTARGAGTLTVDP